MTAALQVYYSGFDSTFFKLSSGIRSRIESKIDEMGLRLDTFPHHRLKGQDRYLLRVGDYRIIYTFEPDKNVIHLLAVGHRREIYKNH